MSASQPYKFLCEPLHVEKNKAELSFYAGQQAGSAHGQLPHRYTPAGDSSSSNSQLSRMTSHICQKLLVSFANSKNLVIKFANALSLKKNLLRCSNASRLQWKVRGGECRLPAPPAAQRSAGEPGPAWAPRVQPAPRRVMRDHGGTMSPQDLPY